MAEFTDQLGHRLTLSESPNRIVSLVPSQTALLYHLGLDDRTVGISSFCTYPDHWYRSKKRVGGTKSINIDRVMSLAPDLVIANKEENERSQVEQLQQRVPVWTSDISRLDDALEMIKQIGLLTTTSIHADDLCAQIIAEFSIVPKIEKPVRTAYLIWKDPFMTIGADTFIHDMLQRAGVHNIFEDRLRYPVITLEDMRSRNCELVLLSSEPYPFAEKHIAELQPSLPGVKILLADGEMFSWYGSHLLRSPAYFQGLQKQLY